MSARSAAEMLGREAIRYGPVRLEGWRRRWSLQRDNPGCEKTFARRDDGRVPAWILSLNIEPVGEPPALEDSAAPNGVLLAASEEDLTRFDAREMRYDRVEVGAQVRTTSGNELVDPPQDPGLAPASLETFDRVFTYTAKPEHLALTPPDGAVILRSYVDVVEAAFTALGGSELTSYAASTDPPGVEIVDGVLVADAIPEGNPREW